MTKPLVFNYGHYERLRDYANDLLLDNQQLMEDNRTLRKEVEELKQLNDGYVKIIAKNQETNNKLMASVAVQGEWNTGKPTKRGKYIVTLIGLGDYRFVDIMHYDKPCMPNREVSGECWYRDDDEWGDVVYDDKDIIAWIPLPTPYKGGDDE